MKKDYKTRNYCFTINNYTKEDLTRLKELAESFEKHNFLCFGLELAPETGTKHIQGYIQLTTSQRFTYLQKYFDLKRKGKLLRFHIEPAKGTPAENIKYCNKDGDFYEYGEPITQGARTDLRQIKEAIRSNPKNIKEVIDDYGNNYQQVKYAEGLRPYYLEPRDPKNPPQVFWLFGDSGIGKTKLVYDTFPNICAISSCKWPGTGYNQNECLLFDDFRAEDIPFNTLLRITDRYPFDLEFKGGTIPLNSPFIVFTTPTPLEEMFYSQKENLKQLQRRVTQINLNFSKPEEIDLYNLDPKHIWTNGKTDNDF